jgi:hypothetical protein
METQNAEVIEVSLEQTIETRLVQNNVTDRVIGQLREKYGNMKLAALDDKESYLELKAAAKDCAKLRTLTVKICKEGRERAVKEQKLWVAKEKEVVGKIAEVEDALDSEVARFDAEVERIANEEKQRKEEAYINRQATLTKYGATYTNGNFVLGDVSFEAELIKGASDDVWEEAVVPKFKEVYEQLESEKVEAERKRAEEAAELKRQQDELLRQQAELKAQQEEMQRQRDEADRQAREKAAEEQREKERQQSALQRTRFEALYPYNPTGADVDMNTLWALAETDFQDLLTIKKKQFEDLQAENARLAEEKRLADIEAAKQEAIRLEQERKAEEERQRKLQLEAATDKKKWDEFIAKVEALPDFDMRSGQYRKKMAAARDKVSEILEL